MKNLVRNALLGTVCRALWEPSAGRGKASQRDTDSEQKLPGTSGRERKPERVVNASFEGPWGQDEARAPCVAGAEDALEV